MIKSLAISTRSLHRKLLAMGSLGTFWPALARGGKLLAGGRVREFAGKLFNESANVRAGDAAPIRSGPVLFLGGHLIKHGGYDHIVLVLLRELINRGVNLHRDPNSVFRMEWIPPHLHPREAVRRVGEPRLVVVPPTLLSRFSPDRATAALTMWETDTLPSYAVLALNHCGLIIVPSEWSKCCFRESGVNVPIEVVPLGHDPEVFSPKPTEPGNSERIVFGTAGALDEGGLRKNIQRVIDLFQLAFPGNPNVVLRVKITPSSPMVRTRNDPRIEVIDRTLSPTELADWYLSLTAYVNASYAEGFGLHLLEAMACGRPLISTTFGGVTAFFDREVGYEVGYRLVEARNAIYSGQWADPIDSGIIELMLRIANDPLEAARLGQAAANRAAKFTWDATADRLIQALVRGYAINW